MTICPARIIGGGDSRAPVIIHVPHAATSIPASVREQILLDDEALELELVRLTDWHVDHLFSWALDLGALMYVNEYSRLVFDPERFADDSLERMAERGQGVVYTRTTQGEVLAEPDAEERASRIRELYEPYHEWFNDLVTRQVERFGVCLILDCHSFATTPLPSEFDQSPDRPDICIGTDAFHTPSGLADSLQSYFGQEGYRVARDLPFDGTLVPLESYRRDERVKSVMIEVRRGLYCDETTGERNSAFAEVRERLRRAVTVAVSDWVASQDCGQVAVSTRR